MTNKAKHHPSRILKEHLFSAEHPYLVVLASSLTSGITVAVTLEWKEHFSAIRNVPMWETILIATTATSLALWVTFITLVSLQKFVGR